MPPATGCPRRVPLSLAVFLALLAAGARGAVYHAYPGDDLDVLASALSAGDTLLLHEGTYSQDMDISGVNGSAGAWITITAAPGEHPRINGRSGSLNGINIGNSSYLRISDIEVIYASDGIKFTAGTVSHHVVIENCHVHACFNVGISSQADEASYVEVRNCEVDDCNSCGFYLGYDAGRIVHHWTVSRCHVHDTSGTSLGYGLQIKPYSYANVVEDCVFHDVAGATRAGIAVYFTDRAGGEENVVRRNVIWNVPRNGASDTTPAIWACADARIENNIAFDCGMGFHTNSWNGHAVSGLRVVNNTFYNCLSEGLYMSDGSGNYACNNAVYGCAIRQAAGWVVSGNLSAAGAAGVFVRTTFGEAGFLYPAAASPLLDAATAGYAPGVDFDTTPRPQGSGPDVGAYERCPAGLPGWQIQAGFKEVVPGGPDTASPALAASSVVLSGTAGDDRTVPAHVTVAGSDFPVDAAGRWNCGPLALATSTTVIDLDTADASGNPRALRVEVRK